MSVPPKINNVVHPIAAPEIELDDLQALAPDQNPVAEVTFEEVEEQAPAKAVSSRANSSNKEFFKKRAVHEISGLQMVEHVITGVEREYMKVVPRSFDDLSAKKALHAFVNASGDLTALELKAAESTLMQEIEKWCMALNDRDKQISVSNLRRYCENSRPALSSQALLALARFYRNSPYSESVRAKFDFVITRLFSRPAPGEKRVCLFERNEAIGHLNTLYSEWSSVPLYTADDDESNVLLTGLSFDDLAAEAEAASNFDQLIASDFFSRLRLFKESISELFYAPSVAAAAIESNIRIGNAYVSLIDKEHNKLDAASIESKFDELEHQGVSDVTGRTLNLQEILRQSRLEANEVPAPAADESTSANPAPEAAVEVPTFSSYEEQERSQPAFVGKVLDSFRSMNRWVMIAGILSVALCIGIYVWADVITETKVSNSGVTLIDVSATPFAEYIQTAKVSGENFYGLLTPAWEALPKERRQEILQKMLETGKERGYRQVTLINKDGKQAGFASATRIDVQMF